MRAVGCRRCRLRSRRPPEVTPPPFGRRAAPFLVCSPLVDAPPRLSATAAWVPALVARRRRVPPVPPPPFGLRPPSAPLTAPLPGGCVCPRRSGRGARSLRGRSVGVSLPPHLAGVAFGAAVPPRLPPAQSRSPRPPPPWVGTAPFVCCLLGVGACAPPPKRAAATPPRQILKFCI